jgi:hypothetical protein
MLTTPDWKLNLYTNYSWLPPKPLYSVNYASTRTHARVPT